MPTDLKVVSLDRFPINDIPAALERLAADIRSGKRAVQSVALAEMDDRGAVHVSGYGPGMEDRLAVIGLLHCSITRMTVTTLPNA